MDLSFVRDLVRSCYATNMGRPSVDPVVFFKLQLIMYFEGIRSERQLMEMAAMRLDHRWYIGYDLGEPVPDHSSLSKIRERYGLEAFLKFFERIVDLCQEAMSQGALLTREDLAYRIFFVSTRTISRDLETLRRTQPDVPIPLRSMVHDIGPVLTHRVRIVRLALEGLTMSEIRARARHSATAIANYVSTFTRCAQLAKRDMQPGQIAFLLRRSRKLVEEYIELLQECELDKNMTYHLEELLRLGRVAGEKNGGQRHVGRTEG